MSVFVTGSRRPTGIWFKHCGWMLVRLSQVCWITLRLREPSGYCMRIPQVVFKHRPPGPSDSTVQLGQRKDMLV